MLQARVLVDLPSEEQERKKSLMDWLASVRGKDVNLATGREELTLSCLSVVEGVGACMRRAGIHNAIALTIDGDPVFVDTAGVDEDAKGLLEAARAASIDHAEFDEVQLVFENRLPGLHVLVEFFVAREVTAGRKEMSVSFAAQLDELAAKSGETLRDYAERLRAFCRSEDTLKSALKSLDRATNRVARELQAQFGIHAVQQGPAEALLVRLESLDTAALAEVSAESDLAAHYRPEKGVAAECPDVYHRYFKDPLYELRNVVMLSELVESETWQTEQLCIVDSAGKVLATGVTEQEDFEAATSGVPSVAFTEDGWVEAAR